MTVHKGEEENDAVTDLPKLQKFLSHISRIKKANKECLLMALELNHFNKLNALYGYDLGNRILYEIAKIISEIIGSNGALYRLSGTDFGIVFFGSCLENIRDIFAQIRDALANFSLDGSAINIEVCGGAIYTKNYKVSYNTVYSYLLSALEKAKDLDLLLVPYESKNGMEDTKNALNEIKCGMSVGILIGPEGGFDEKEIQEALEIDGKVISLGKRILRTETAAITALGMCMLYAEMNLNGEDKKVIVDTPVSTFLVLEDKLYFVPIELLENLRIARVYTPKVLEMMSDLEFGGDCWWGDTQEERDDASAFLRRLKNNYGIE